jgi:hypothetical protein
MSEASKAYQHARSLGVHICQQLVKHVSMRGACISAASKACQQLVSMSACARSSILLRWHMRMHGL